MCDPFVRQNCRFRATSAMPTLNIQCPVCPVQEKPLSQFGRGSKHIQDGFIINSAYEHKERLKTFDSVRSS